MKKILLFFLILTSLSYSAQETLSIDEALDRVGNDRGSYEFKKFQYSQEGTNIKIKDNIIKFVFNPFLIYILTKFIK